MYTDECISEFIPVRQIGKGIINVTHLMKPISDDEIVVIKTFPLDEFYEFSTDKPFCLKHRNLVDYYSIFRDEKTIYIKQEYCDGGSLVDVMNNLNRKLTEIEISAIFRFVLKGMIFLHANNLISQQIKGSDILLMSNGTVKLNDASYLADIENFVQKYRQLFRASYWIPPEVVFNIEFTSKYDIWSLGITALELYDKHPLFEMTHLVYLLKMSSISIEPPENASQFFRSFILRTLRKDPKERPTAAELIEDPFITQLSEESCIEIIRTLVKSSLLHKNKDEYEEEWEEEEEEEEGEEEEEK